MKNLIKFKIHLTLIKFEQKSYKKDVLNRYVIKYFIVISDVDHVDHRL